MSSGRNDRPSVVNRLREAGAGTISWQEALKSASDFVGGAGSAVFGLDRRTGEFEGFFVHGLEPGAGDYVQRMNQINPRMRSSLGQPGPHVTCDYAILPEVAIRRHEFYDWMERTNGTRYFVGSRVADKGDGSIFALIEFTTSQGHPDGERIEAFASLLPHLEDAWSLSLLLARIGAESAAAAAVRESSPWGILMLDGRGCVLSLNAKADRLLAAADGLTTVEGTLHAVYAAEDRALAAILAAKLDGGCSAFDTLRSLLPIRRPSGRLPLIVRIASLPLERGPAAGHPTLLVFVSDVSEALNLSETELQHLFGLSKREAALVMSLAEGLPLPAAARRMGVSHNTARAHLRDVFAKTGTRSQVQLVRLLSRVPTL